MQAVSPKRIRQRIKPAPKPFKNTHFDRCSVMIAARIRWKAPDGQFSALPTIISQSSRIKSAFSHTSAFPRWGKNRQNFTGKKLTVFRLGPKADKREWDWNVH